MGRGGRCGSRGAGGQSCGSTSRAFIHEAIHDRVLERVVAAVRAIKPGIPIAQSTSQITCVRVEGFAERETGTGFSLTREAVRDSSTPFALLATLRMTS
ncbi:MAG: aldehyde dehydrogenase family protein, partial [Candidatus Binataceae bacterium]